ncbi:hypothetical protein [Tropicimonas isoalkanivorans]|uniref:hypothetical protein n=1 Tax=Tropicimonas isoalkanivorans TaxID=441112 RepID=UPI0015A5AA42|nr:hypothetical protein [Tropicimonas isoalkanivorans]
MIYNRPRLGQAVQLIVPEEPPTGVDFLAALIDDISIDPSGKVRIIGDDFAAQNVLGPIGRFLRRTTPRKNKA